MKPTDLIEDADSRASIENDIKELTDELNEINLTPINVKLIQIIEDNPSFTFVESASAAGISGVNRLRESGPARRALTLKRKINNLITIKNSILTKTEAISILRNIAINADKPYGQIQSIAQLSKMLGWDAPTKVISENTNTTQIKFEEDKPEEEKSEDTPIPETSQEIPIVVTSTDIS